MISSSVDLLERHFPSQGITWVDIAGPVFKGVLPHRVRPAEFSFFHQMFPFVVAAALSCREEIPSLGTKNGLEKVAKSLSLFADISNISCDQRTVLRETFGRITIKGDADLEDSTPPDIMPPDIILCTQENIKKYVPQNWLGRPFSDRYDVPFVVCVKKGKEEREVALPRDINSIREFGDLINKHKENPFLHGKSRYRAKIVNGEPKLYILSPEEGELITILNEGLDSIVFGGVFRSRPIISLPWQQGDDKRTRTLDVERLADAFVKRQKTDEEIIARALRDIFPDVREMGGYLSYMEPGQQSIYDTALFAMVENIRQQPDHSLWGRFYEDIHQEKNKRGRHPTPAGQHSARGLTP